MQNATACPSSFWLFLGLLLITAAVPALYAGAMLVEWLDVAALFPVPAGVCAALAGYALWKAETL